MLPAPRRLAISCQRIFSRPASSNISPADYCLNLVKQYDYENFLCSLLLPNKIRRTAFCIRAFNIEVALIEDKSAEDRIRHMRYQWWENTLGTMYGSGTLPEHPVVQELNKVVRDHKLLKKQLSRLLAARRRSIPKDGFDTMGSMEAYAEESTSPVYYLILQSAGLKNVDVDHAASHIGKAQGIVNLIRAIQHHVSKRRSIMPMDVMMKHNVPQEVMLSGQQLNSPGVRNVIFDVASSAKVHIDMARKLSKEVPADAKAVFLPAVSVDLYLERLRDTDFDVMFCSTLAKDSRLGLRLLWKKLTRSY